jgi:hypothetical protein
MWISFFTAAGGGVRGKGAGIVHGIIIPVGDTIGVFRLFMSGYHRNGETTIGRIAGEVISGTTNPYLISRFNETGEAGKKTNIGRSRIPGGSGV